MPRLPRTEAAWPIATGVIPARFRRPRSSDEVAPAQKPLRRAGDVRGTYPRTGCDGGPVITEMSDCWIQCIGARRGDAGDTAYRPHLPRYPKGHTASAADSSSFGFLSPPADPPSFFPVVTPERLTCSDPHRPPTPSTPPTAPPTHSQAETPPRPQYSQTPSPKPTSGDSSARYPTAGSRISRHPPSASFCAGRGYI